jgi:hypothetical protein
MYLIYPVSNFESCENTNMTHYILHGLLFFFAAFAQYWIEMSGRQSNGAVFLLLALPVLGVYFLSWWSLLTYISGLFLGAKFFIQEKNCE